MYVSVHVHICAHIGGFRKKSKNLVGVGALKVQIFDALECGPVVAAAAVHAAHAHQRVVPQHKLYV